jgi:uncharacterized Zn-binding protein involved in type VI secretion
MPKLVARVGAPTDMAGPGGVLLSPLVPNVTVGGLPIAVVGTKVTPHGKTPHNVATMATGSPNVWVGPAKLPVCGTGHVATCGHPLVVGPSARVFIN